MFQELAHPKKTPKQHTATATASVHYQELLLGSSILDFYASGSWSHRERVAI